MQTDGGCSSWADVDRGLGFLAHSLDAAQSPREAQFHAALEELARGPLLEIPTETEALDWAG